MIIFAKPSKPFTYTAKATPRRHAIIAEYSDEINQVYEAVKENTVSAARAPAQWDRLSTIAFVREVIRQVLVDRPIGDDENIFELGCDR
jgi:hypothetical protein